MAKELLFIDSETYRNFFLAGGKTRSGKVRFVEAAEGEDIDGERLERIMEGYLTVGFNSRNFDLPVIYAAINGHPVEVIKEIADKIIIGGAKPWDIERDYDFEIPRKLDHIDLIELPIGQASLKIYGGRIHAPRMQDLPIQHDAILTPKEMDVTYDYWLNDLDTTMLLFDKLKPQIELREKLGAEYRQDLRSKSDAQIAEAVIKAQVSELLDRRVKRPEIRGGTSYRYRVPDFIRYRLPVLQEVLDDVAESRFVLSAKGKVDMPKSLQERKIAIGGSVYRMGIGGLHSSEQCAAHVADDDCLLVDRDVTSYYPAIIIGQELAPKHLGWAFQKVYKKIVDRRVKAKREGDKVTADTLKIVVNGSFGKFGSKWSVLFSPDLLIQTTVTGQLALLMLIERLEWEGIPVVSANTDGVVIKCPKRKEDDMAEVIREWERDTGYETEETRYSAIYSRDVNNYCAIKLDGSVKTKGAYADPGLSKNPANQICVEAAIAQITKGIPVAKTIRECDDIRKFVTIRTVKGGAVDQDGNYLGKAIRWVYATDVRGAITYASNGYTVARTEGAMPVMQLPDRLPENIDYRWYVREARSILEAIGYEEAIV